MKYSISIYAEGDREVPLAEIVELADAVAQYSGIASGAGTMGYGAQLVFEAENQEAAIKLAVRAFEKSVLIAKLPIWPITTVDSISELEEFELEED